MKNIFLCFLLALTSFLRAQISVYDCTAFNPVVTQNEIDNSGYEFNRTCVEFSNQTYNFSGSSNKKITASTSIHLKSGFKAGAFSGTNGMWLKMGEKSDFDVAVMNYADLNDVLKYEKLELGVVLPTEILNRVNNFTNKVPGTENNRINPYLEWEIRVQAIFTHGTDQPIIIDGFYFKEYSTYMADPLPVPADGQAYTDQEYRQIGGYTEIPTNHPFRIRFAPPSNGNWTCSVKLTTPSAEYIANDFVFNVVESGNSGYISAGPGGRYLKIDGASFYPSGCNISWPETKEEFDPELYQYHTYTENNIEYRVPEAYRQVHCVPRVYDKYKERLEMMTDAGANYYRMIMYPASTEIEFEDLGNYTSRLSMAQELDEIVELAEERNFYLHWNSQIHMSFQYSNAAYYSRWTWENLINGKNYCYRTLTNSTNPLDFFTNEEAKKYYKQRLRYILSRYGYSTSIAIFELFSEINNCAPDGLVGVDLYEANWYPHRDWQVEMGNYVKSFYNGQKHLLTTNYAGMKNATDNTFNYPCFDVMTTNIYDFETPEFSSHWNEGVARTRLNDNSGDHSYTQQWYPTPSGGKNIKPLISSETDPLVVVEKCRENEIEINRLLWEAAFSGLAGAFSWENWYHTDNYAIFGQIKNFMSQFNLDAERWHPGASELFDYGTVRGWYYDGDNIEDMNRADSKADIAYLRSGDGNFAVGVITNKTYNAGNSANNCYKWPDLEELEYDQPQTVNPNTEGLKLRGLNTDRYFVNYFLPSDLTNPIHSTDDFGPRVKLELNIAPTMETYIVLFMARRSGENWSSVEIPDVYTSSENLAFTNSVEFLKESSTLPDNEHIDIELFPVPASDKITIQAEQHMGFVSVSIQTMDGRLVDTFTMQQEKMEYDIVHLEKGTYLAVFSIDGKIIESRKIAKL